MRVMIRGKLRHLRLPWHPKGGDWTYGRDHKRFIHQWNGHRGEHSLILLVVEETEGSYRVFTNSGKQEISKQELKTLRRDPNKWLETQKMEDLL